MTTTANGPALVRDTAATVTGNSDCWPLFLDRDGVINRQIVGDYVRSWGDFEFLPGALDALVVLAGWAPHIVVVTNQQGIGRSVMSPADLDDIHTRMLAAITEAGGRIDAVRFCPHLATAGCLCRKPEPGMATSWLAENPSVDGAQAVVVGDSPSDMEMARRLGAITGGVQAVRLGTPGRRGLEDMTFTSLADFAATIRANCASHLNATR